VLAAAADIDYIYYSKPGDLRVARFFYLRAARF
jgi:hypothetical protein